MGKPNESVDDLLGVSYDELEKKIANDNEKSKESSGFEPEEGVYRLKLDAKKNGGAVGRFLPFKDLRKTYPWIEIPIHRFTHGDKTFKFVCPKFWDPEAPCPSCDENQKYFKKKNYKLSVIYWSKKSYVTNFFVIKDDKQPEMVGKIFKMYYGQQVQSIFDSALKPEIDDEPPLIFWHPEKGADFLYISKGKDTEVGRYADYTTSKFKNPSKLDLSNSDYKTYLELLDGCYSSEDIKKIYTKKTYDEICLEFENTFGIEITEPFSVLSSNKTYKKDTPKKSFKEDSKKVTNKKRDEDFESDDDETEDFDLDKILD